MQRCGRWIKEVNHIRTLSIRMERIGVRGGMRAAAGGAAGVVQRAPQSGVRAGHATDPAGALGGHPRAFRGAAQTGGQQRAGGVGSGTPGIGATGGDRRGTVGGAGSRSAAVSAVGSAGRRAGAAGVSGAAATFSHRCGEAHRLAAVLPAIGEVGGGAMYAPALLLPLGGARCGVIGAAAAAGGGRTVPARAGWSAPQPRSDADAAGGVPPLAAVPQPARALSPAGVGRRIGAGAGSVAARAGAGAGRMARGARRPARGAHRRAQRVRVARGHFSGRCGVAAAPHGHFSRHVARATTPIGRHAARPTHSHLLHRRHPLREGRGVSAHAPRLFQRAAIGRRYRGVCRRGPKTRLDVQVQGRQLRVRRATGVARHRRRLGAVRDLRHAVRQLHPVCPCAVSPPLYSVSQVPATIYRLLRAEMSAGTGADAAERHRRTALVRRQRIASAASDAVGGVAGGGGGGDAPPLPRCRAHAQRPAAGHAVGDAGAAGARRAHPRTGHLHRLLGAVLGRRAGRHRRAHRDHRGARARCGRHRAVVLRPRADRPRGDPPGARSRRRGVANDGAAKRPPFDSSTSTPTRKVTSSTCST
eukprot:ctg_366.g226